MGLFDSLLGAALPADLVNLATKLGLEPETLAKAVGALAQAHTAPEDTVTLAAQETGLAPDLLKTVIAQIGGEGSLGEYARTLHEGGGFGDLIGKMFGKN